MARLVACGNEQMFGPDNNITFAVAMTIMTISGFKLIFALSLKRCARHTPRDFKCMVKVKNDSYLRIDLGTPKGLDI